MISEGNSFCNPIGEWYGNAGSYRLGDARLIYGMVGFKYCCASNFHDERVFIDKFDGSTIRMISFQM